MSLRNLLSRWGARFRRSVSAKPVRRTAYPSLEPLEGRSLMAAGAVKTFVASLYQSVANRDGAEGEIQFYNTQYRTVWSAAQVADNILAGYESQAQFINNEHLRLLGRKAGNEGLNDWAIRLANGTYTRDQLTAQLLGSDEFYILAGNAPDRFAQSVYRAIFRREIDPQGATELAQQLQAGVSRESIALKLLNTVESDRVKATLAYQDILNRDPTDAERQEGARFLQNGGRETELLASIFGSNEYYASVTGFARRTTETEPNQAARQFLRTYVVRPLPQVIPPGLSQPHQTPEDPAMWSPSYAARKGWIDAADLLALAEAAARKDGSGQF